MPEKLIHAICRRDPGVTPAELASRFRVSEKAMEIQLSNISPPQPFTQPSGRWLRSLTYRRHVVFFARVTAADDEPVILCIVHEWRNMPALVYFDALEG